MCEHLAGVLSETELDEQNVNKRSVEPASHEHTPCTDGKQWCIQMCGIIPWQSKRIICTLQYTVYQCNMARRNLTYSKTTVYSNFFLFALFAAPWHWQQTVHKLMACMLLFCYIYNGSWNCPVIFPVQGWKKTFCTKNSVIAWLTYDGLAHCSKEYAVHVILPKFQAKHNRSTAEKVFEHVLRVFLKPCRHPPLALAQEMPFVVRFSWSNVWQASFWSCANDVKGSVHSCTSQCCRNFGKKNG